MNSTQPKILAIDDHRDNLITLQAVLKDALPGYNLLTALDGAAGIEIARSEDPDAILLDIVMPNMDGFEVCTRLKADGRMKDIPVIFLTALGTDRESRVRALEVGAEAFLSKPWNDQELVAQIRAMIKLKAANRMRRLVQEQLEDMVADRTRELEKELAERRRVEAALRRSNENWGNTFNAITDIVFVISNKHDILEVNHAGCLALDRSKDQILGRKCFELMHGRTSPIPGCPCLQSIVECKPCMGEYAEHGKHYNLVAWPTLDEHGRVISLAHVIKDVTQDKKTEAERLRLKEQLRAAQKMEAIGSLAGGIAHDFNNMLYVIMSFTDLVLDATDQGDARRSQLIEVKKASERAAALIRQLLAFSRKQILKPVALDLNRVTTELQKMLHRILGEDIALVPVLAPDLGSIMVDPSQIEQVLMNLVVNARDAMPTGGKLTIETANVELDAAFMMTGSTVRPGPYIMLAVTDTGCGMDKETADRIFEPFFTTKERGKGTGLGLSTVYGIVRQSGGEIIVQSQRDQGTTFRIYLPRSEASAEEAPAILPVAARLTGDETILVVEDEPAVRDLAKQVLAKAGYTVMTAANGDEALQLCERQSGKIHLALTDVVMPGMGGRVFAEQLTRLRPDIKILYMSGYTDDAIDHHGTLDPGTHLITKPFSLTDLRRKVRELLDGN
jgi:signal transduction histidine kinase/response regulator RpfG family c-di-GMP phosphodiesterase